MKQKLTFAAVLALTVVAVWYSFSLRHPVALGLDLRGGMRVTLQPDYKKLDGKTVDAETMRLVRTVIENRVNSFGLSGAEVRLKGQDQVLVLLPGARNPEEALAHLVTVAQLEFRHLQNVQSDRNLGGRYRMTHLPGNPEKGEPDRYRFFDTATNKAATPQEVLEGAPLILKGDTLKPTAEMAIDPNRGEPYVSFEFEPRGAKAFGEFTTDNVGEILAVVLDGEIISAPVINEPITGGEGQISGGFRTAGEARVLANLLNSGALPVPLQPAETQTVGATLGQESIRQSIQAGIAGLGIVLLFMLGYYWLPGLVACLALTAYAALTFSIFKGIPLPGQAGYLFPPIVLDLPGITGFILSIGMAVDGNVLVFERMKEELRAGRSMNNAVEVGFRRAFAAIVDSNVTVWIICAILIWLGTPMVKGFAITLAIGNAVAMFTAITVTRVFLQLLTRMRWAQNPRWYGVYNSWLNLFFPAWRTGGVIRIWDRRRVYFGASIALAAMSVVLILLTPFGYGLRPGIDFTGGSVLEVAFREPSVTREQVVEALKSRNLEDATVRMGRSERPWTRVQLTAGEVDPLAATQVRERLSGGEALASFDPAGYETSGAGKAFRATAVFAGPVDQSQVRAALTGAGAPDLPQLNIQVETLPREGASAIPVAEIATKQLPPTKLAEIREVLGKIGGGTIEPMSRVTSIGPSIATEVARNGLFSTVVASVAMLIFLAARFAIGGLANGLKFGVGAVVALAHDVLITVGFFALMGWLAGWSVDSLFLTACLGLLGFSVNDTIVIYDRVRENLAARRRGESFAALTDRSLTESFDRSVNTSFAIMLALLAMVVFGGETLRLFNIALLFGMAVGTYSSVFVATPLVVRLSLGESEASHASTERAVTLASTPAVIGTEGGAVDTGTATPYPDSMQSTPGRVRPRRTRRH